MNAENLRNKDAASQKALIKGFYLARNDLGIEAVVDGWDNYFSRGFRRASMEYGYLENGSQSEEVLSALKEGLIRTETDIYNASDQGEMATMDYQGYLFASNLTQWERNVVTQFICVEE